MCVCVYKVRVWISIYVCVCMYSRCVRPAAPPPRANHPRTTPTQPKPNSSPQHTNTHAHTQYIIGHVLLLPRAPHAAGARERPLLHHRRLRAARADAGACKSNKQNEWASARLWFGCGSVYCAPEHPNPQPPPYKPPSKPLTPTPQKNITKPLTFI